MASRRQGGAPVRLLVFLPNWLGDVVMATPLLEYLHRALAAAAPASGSRLDLAVRPAWAPLFRDDPRVGRLITVDRDGRHGGLAGIPRLGREFRTGGYDAVVLGPPSLRAALVAAWARIPLRVGHAGDGRDLLLGTAVARGPRGTRHHAWELLDLGLAVLDGLGLEGPPLPASALPAPALRGCESWAAAELPADRPLWALGPGTTYGEAKTWPVARVAELVARITAGGAGRAVLVGDAAAAPFARAVREQAGVAAATSPDPAADLIDLTGRTDLSELVRVLKAAAVFVGNDSGPMHLAAAVGVPTVGVFGSSDPDWTRPLGARTAACTAEGFACRPCFRRTCNQPQFCLETVTAAAVHARAQALLADPAVREVP